MILVDTGPLVALLDRTDPRHRECASLAEAIKEPVATSWPVVTEALYLLRGSWQWQQRLLGMLRTRAFRLLDLGLNDLPRITQLMQKYRDLPMDFADATLVRLAEREGIRRVFTLDHRDFSIYRPRNIGRFEILP